MFVEIAELGNKALASHSLYMNMCKASCGHGQTSRWVEHNCGRETAFYAFAYLVLTAIRSFATGIFEKITDIVMMFQREEKNSSLSPCCELLQEN